MFTPQVMARMPKETAKRFMAVDLFVAETLKAMERGDHHLVLPKRYRGVVILKNLFPKLMARKVGSVRLEPLDDVYD